MSVIAHFFITLAISILSLFFKTHSPILNPTSRQTLVIPQTINFVLSASITPTPSLSGVPPLKSEIYQLRSDTAPWGVAQQIDQHTWTMKVGQDPVMASPLEVLDSLNQYRRRHNVQPLIWDDKLAAFAQSRAGHLADLKSTDSHQGFQNYLENEDGYTKLGYSWLGENISYGYRMSGVHLIEWIYGGDQDHDDNQLNSRWDHVGIGIVGTATCLIFATGKM